MKLSKLKMLAGIVMVLPVLVVADEVNTQSGFSLGAGVGILQPSGDRDLESGDTTAFNGAYRFDPNWEIEVTTLGSDIDGDGVLDSDADVRSSRLDFNYYFNNGNWQPYVSAGAGITKYDYDDGSKANADDSPLDLGLGLKYFFNPSWFARGDVRGFTVSEGTDNAITFSVGHMFNQHKEELPPADSDNDGVIDDLDQCPATPADVSVDGKGCPMDTDGDGVLDFMDQCLNSSAGAVVNESGCEKISMSMNLTVEFPNNSAELGPIGSHPDFDAAVAFLSTHTNVSATIEGHTDSRGAAAYNQALSTKRAKAAVDRLIERGVDAGRVSSVGYGESKPIADNDTVEGRQTNRRIFAVLEATETASE
jgi:OOP family OmpA-OmpF porin|tara:strand:- start:7547 stop:8641 length:1095 start_codon:yes stop_codon:yes gene_type:complete